MKGFHRGGAGEDTKSNVATLGLDFPRRVGPMCPPYSPRTVSK